MLDFSCLTHYDWLDVPMWVYDQERQRNLWANAAALSFWRADSAEEFLSSDLSDMSASVAERLAVTAADHTQGKLRARRENGDPSGFHTPSHRGNKAQNPPWLSWRDSKGAHKRW